MKTILALAVTSLLALSAPALAQNAGAPGATGTGGSLTGSNTGTGFNSDRQYYEGGPRYMDEGRAAAPDYEPTGPDSPPMMAPRMRDGSVDDR